MGLYVLDLKDIDRTKHQLVGEKGANLGELRRIGGVRVPDGFCITTQAFKRMIGDNILAGELIEELSMLKAGDRNRISQLANQIRLVMEKMTIAPDIAEEIGEHLDIHGRKMAFAVRSSATAEDLPSASFAGQQDTYLNIIGKESLLEHINRCWASLYNERAILYRIQNGFNHQTAYSAVVVQKMVFPRAAGILFTADPVNSNRKISSVDAGFGLGEGLVSGRINPDNYKIRDGRILQKKISSKQLAIYAAKDGGTFQKYLDEKEMDSQVLADDEILELEKIGRRIESHFAGPQDIEWCLCDDGFHMVQSRPVTTIFPIPTVGDRENHVFVSVGHQQMMTDPIKPLGLSFFLLLTRAAMFKAGGRLFVDVTPMLATPSGRESIINVLGKSDPLTRDALQKIVERGDFIKSPSESLSDQAKKDKGRSPEAFQTLKDYDPAIVADLTSVSQKSLEDLKLNIQTKSGSGLMDFILKDIEQLKQRFAEPNSFGVIMTAMNASTWINEKMNEWIGEKNAADKISQSLPNNITSEMGLELLDLADLIRDYPEIINFLEHVSDDNYLDELDDLNGGALIGDAIRAYLDKYGMRCPGEIDITNARWSEKPSALVPMILSHIRNLEPGASRRKFEQGLQEAMKKENELLDRLKKLPDGESKAGETKRMIDLVRNLSGYREYPKYEIVSRYFLYKQALLKEAGQLQLSGVIREKEDIFYLSFEELREVRLTQKLDKDIINKRKEEYKLYEKLSPPRVMTSDGEIISGTYRRGNIPPGSLAGLAVSSGITEGRARIILNMEETRLEDGDILVTAFTDPGWTPLFMSIRGLVTEVGGLMTHGAVIAREYGIPTVVGVENATRLIKDGQRIRVNGTEGYVEIL